MISLLIARCSGDFFLSEITRNNLCIIYSVRGTLIECSCVGSILSFKNVLFGKYEKFQGKCVYLFFE